MHAFINAFKRKAKLQSEQISRSKMHWRHKENGWEVVSTALCDQWDNAVHPEGHDDFETTLIGGDDEQDGFPRYSPETPSDWETFHTEENRMPTIFDRDAYIEFESAFRNGIDYLNAEEAAEFLHDTFEAHYEFDNPYRDCSSCNGTGRVHDGSESLTYCYNDCGDNKHEKLRVSDEQCSCTSANEMENMVECDECDGVGEIERDGFTRTFPYKRDKILSEMPSKRELQVLQFTINKMAKIAEKNDTTVSFRKILRLFAVLENGDDEALIEQAISHIKPTIRTVEKPVRTPEGTIATDERGNPVMEEKPDPDAIEQTKVKLTATLNGVTEKQARTQHA